MTTRPAPGLSAIIGYKSLKAGIQLGLAFLLCALWPLGLPEKLQELAFALRSHATHGWAIGLSELLAGNASARRIEWAIAALALDGGLTALEAWALKSAKWWGPWLVVLATGSLLPFEVYEFWRVPHLSRALVFALNLAILVYLARCTVRERSAG